MKKKKILYIFFLFLPLILTTIAVFFLPEKIPMHYDAAGNITRLGSKYESFVIPIISIVSGLFFPWITKISSTQKELEENRQTILLSQYIILITFNLLTIIFLISGFLFMKYNFTTFNFNIILFISLGLIFIIMGKYLPRLKKNSLIGIRIKWTLEDNDIWLKTHKLGGKLFIILGLFLLLSPFVIKGSDLMLCSMGSIAIVFIFLIAYSYILYFKK